MQLTEVPARRAESMFQHLLSCFILYPYYIHYRLVYTCSVYTVHIIPLHFYCCIDVPQSAGVLYTVHIREWVDGGCDILDPSAAIFHRPRCSIVVLLIYSKREKNCLPIWLILYTSTSGVILAYTCIPSLNKKYNIYVPVLMAWTSYIKDDIYNHSLWQDGSLDNPTWNNTKQFSIDIPGCLSTWGQFAGS